MERTPTMGLPGRQPQYTQMVLPQQPDVGSQWRGHSWALPSQSEPFKPAQRKYTGRATRTQSGPPVMLSTTMQKNSSHPIVNEEIEDLIGVGVGVGTQHEPAEARRVIRSVKVAARAGSVTLVHPIDAQFDSEEVRTVGLFRAWASNIVGASASHVTGVSVQDASESYDDAVALTKDTLLRGIADGCIIFVEVAPSSPSVKTMLENPEHTGDFVKVKSMLAKSRQRDVVADAIRSFQSGASQMQVRNELLSGLVDNSCRNGEFVAGLHWVIEAYYVAPNESAARQAVDLARTVLLPKAARFGDAIAALGGVEWLIAVEAAPTAADINYAINAIARSSDSSIDEAVALMRRMPELGLSPDAATYFGVITSCVNSKPSRGDIAMDVLVQMQDNSIQPDLQTFNSVINACAHSELGLVEGVMEVLSRMDSAGVVPDQLTYSSVIHACARSFPSRGKEAIEVLHKMTEQGFKPTRVTCNRVISACANSKPSRVKEAVEVLESMASRGLEPNQVSFTNVIHAFANAKPSRVKDAMAMLTRMQSLGLEPNQIIYSSMIHACVNCKPARVEDAMMMLKLMMAQGVGSRCHTTQSRMTRSCNNVISTCANSKPARVEEAMTVLHMMTSQGFVPNQITCNSVINACANSAPAHVEGAMDVLQWMVVQGLEPNRLTYNRVINACANSEPARVDEAMAVLQWMTAQGLDPDRVTFNSVLKACAHRKPANLSIALDIANQMGELGIAVDHYALPALLNCCAYNRPRQPQQAEQLFRHYIHQGDVHLNEHVEKALRKAVDHATAEGLVRWAKESHAECTRPPSRQRGRSSGNYNRVNGSMTATNGNMRHNSDNTSNGSGNGGNKMLLNGSGRHEMRIDDNDGRPYTQRTFIKQYGGSRKQSNGTVVQGTPYR